MKRLFIISVLFLILFLTGCGPIRVKRDYAKLQHKTQEQLGYSIAPWQDMDKKSIPKAAKTGQPYVELPSMDGNYFSRQQAIGFALKNNFELLAAFEDLGIAKSDLKQAGLFTNPHVNLLPKFPIFGLLPEEKAIINRHTKIDFDAVMELADFWQVPIKKKVAHDDLEIMTLTILHLIIETSVQTKFAYDTCLYMETRLCLLEKIHGKIFDLQERTIYRQDFGLESDLDRYFIAIHLAEMGAKIIQQKAELRAAYANLRNIMGLKITSDILCLTDPLDYENKPIPSVEALETHGITSRPALNIKYLKIQKAEHELSLQKRKIFDTVNFGISYERDLIQGQGVGPAFRMRLPFFDPNYAQITRARFELKKANKNYKAEKRQMLEEIYQNYEHLRGLQEQVDVYRQMLLPSVEKALDYSSTFFERMQLDMMSLLKSTITFFEAQEAILTRNYEMAKEYAQLEKTIGKILT